MKKFMVMALMAVAASSAFAQGDALKSILKAKTYADAEALLNSNVTSFSSEQKAKAYNKLVQLSLEKVQKEEGIMSANAVAKQMGQKEEPFDTLGMYNSLCAALKDAMECDKFDNEPNGKGKIAPKFHKNNQQNLWPLRLHLLNAGQDAVTAGKQQDAIRYYGMYVQSGSDHLFADRDMSKGADQYLGEVARVTAVLAFQNKDNDLANKYCDIALTDTASYKDALSLKMYLMQQTLKTREDSVKCLTQFEQLYAKDKSEEIFSNLANLYGNLGMADKQDALIDAKMAEDPKCFSAYAVRAQTRMNESKFDEAADNFKKAIEIEPKKSILYTYLGFCLNAKAAGIENTDAQKKVVEESMGYLEKARDLDPSCSESNWSYPLYQCYYTLFGENDSRTIELKKLSGN